MPGFRERFPPRAPADRRDPPAAAARLPRFPGPRSRRRTCARRARRLPRGRAGRRSRRERARPAAPREAGRETIAAMTPVTRELVAAAARLPSVSRSCSTTRRPRSRSRSRLGADFIRTDYFADEMSAPSTASCGSRPQQVIAYRAAHRRRARARAGGHPGQVRADDRPATLAESARAARASTAPTPIVVTGTPHGRAALAATTCRPRARARATARCSIGSGLDPANARALLAVADGAIVGHEPDERRARDFEQVAALTVGALVKIVCAADCGVDRHDRPRLRPRRRHRAERRRACAPACARPATPSRSWHRSATTPGADLVRDAAARTGVEDVPRGRPRRDARAAHPPGA